MSGDVLRLPDYLQRALRLGAGDQTVPAESSASVPACSPRTISGIDVAKVNPGTVDAAWVFLMSKNDPPALFRRQRKIVMPIGEGVTSSFDHLFSRQLNLRIAQVCGDERGAQLVEVDHALFAELLARAVPFIRLVKKKGGASGERVGVRTYPAEKFVKQMMATAVCPLPFVSAITRSPIFVDPGTLLSAPGHHAPSGMFYAPPPGFELPVVPNEPTADDLRRALALWNEMVVDFPFDDEAAEAHVLALAITALVRELIKGPVPMFLVSKPATGTGGTLLLQCVGLVVLGEALPESAWSSNEEEQRKYLTTILYRGRLLNNLDNITHLHSKDLLSVLSGDVREDRRLGGNELLTIPNRSVFVGSGNNVTYDEEHAGRLVVVRLDAKVENPRLRDKEFRHPNLYEWVKEQRPRILAAVITVIQSWLAAGRPAYSGKRLAGFEAWSNVVGGILQHAGVPAFLDNRDQVMRNAQRAQDEDVDFVAAWYACMNPEPSKEPTLTGSVRTKELLDASGLIDVIPQPRNGVRPSTVSLGRYLERNVDKVRVLDGGTHVAIRRAAEDKHAHAQRWILDVLEAQHEAPTEAPPF